MLARKCINGQIKSLANWHAIYAEKLESWVYVLCLLVQGNHFETMQIFLHLRDGRQNRYGLDIAIFAGLSLIMNFSQTWVSVLISILILKSQCESQAKCLCSI